MRREEFILGTCLYALLIAAGFAWPVLEKTKWPRVEMSLPSLKPFLYSHFLRSVPPQLKTSSATGPSGKAGTPPPSAFPADSSRN